MVEEKNQTGERQISEDDLEKIMQDIVAEETAAGQEAKATSATGGAPIASVAPLTPVATEPPVAVSAPQNVSSSRPAVSEIKPVAVPIGNTASEQSLKLEFTGPISLKLQFCSGAKTIDIACTDDFLVCRMADGTEFKIPTNGFASSLKKSA